MLSLSIVCASHCRFSCPDSMLETSRCFPETACTFTEISVSAHASDVHSGVKVICSRLAFPPAGASTISTTTLSVAYKCMRLVS